MLYNYQAIDQQGSQKQGSIEAVTIDVAINSLQRRGLVISSIKPVDSQISFLEKSLAAFDKVKIKDIVILSRQIATLFEAQVSALRVFRLLATETENPALRNKLADVADELQGGSSISKALARHPEVFSDFYVNMVKSGEESGKLDQTFLFLADYLDRTYEVTSKAKNALIYPAFVVFTFCAVMILMLTMVIPKISGILIDSGQEIPLYTKIVIGMSNFLVNYSLFLGIFVAIGGFLLYRFVKTSAGSIMFDNFKLNIPYVGNLYTKLYLSRIADNLNTMLASGIAMVRALELTISVVDNKVYADAIGKSLEEVRGGSALSDAFGHHPEIPNIMIQMIKVGEETGNLASILETLAKFYRREVSNAVDTLVGLIEPLMIVALGLGVGVLLAAVLIPIYNVASTF